jgi:hypothetical protein
MPPRTARLRAAVVAAALAAGLGAPAAYALETATTPHTGAIPSAGPAGASSAAAPAGVAAPHSAEAARRDSGPASVEVRRRGSVEAAESVASADATHSAACSTPARRIKRW